RKPLTFSRLAIMDPPGDTMAQTTPPKRERFHNEMKCLKIPSKFVRFSTFGASISLGRSRLHAGASGSLKLWFKKNLGKESGRESCLLEFLDFEDSCSGFCPSITGSSLPQLHLGIKYPNLID
nr:hypothetical protein [Tanacetum cinerariifolium]